MFVLKYLKGNSNIQSESAGHETSLNNRASSQLRSEIREYVNTRRPNENRQKAVETLESASTSLPSRVSLAQLQLRKLPPDQLVADGAGQAKDLSLAHNSFKTIPRAILNLSNLETLSISNNSLREIPDRIGNLTNLRSIDLSTNAIEVIPDEIGKLAKLKSLDVSSNKLIRLPDDIADLTRLETLSLQENLLTELPSIVGNLTRLKKLNLASNRLTRLPGEVGFLKGLEKLNVADNKLSADDAIPSSVANLKALKKLNVSGNPLSMLHVDFGPFQYVSTSKMTIGRQRSGYELPWGQLTINIANTYLPQVLAPARLARLPVDHIPTFKEPYEGPVSSSNRTRTRDRQDGDEGSSIRSESTYRHEDGPLPARRDRSEIRTQRDVSDSESSRYASQDGDEGRDRQAFGREGRRDSKSRLQARMRRGETNSTTTRMRPSGSHGSQPAPQGPREFSRPSYSEVRTRIDDHEEEVDGRSSVRSEFYTHADGSRLPRRGRSEIRTQRDISDSESPLRAPQDGDEATDPRASDRADLRDSRFHGKEPMEEGTRMRPPPVSKHVRFEDVPYQGVPYRPGLAQGREYQPVGDHRSGFSGPTVVPQPTPVLNALLAKLHEATVSRNTNFAPQPAFQRGYGNTLQEQVAARGSLYDYSMPLYGDPQIDESFNQLTIQKRNADNLRALKTRYPIRTEEATLKNILDVTKNYSKKIYEDMRNIGHMMYRQEVINELAERTAEANRQDNESNVDKSAPYKEEDPHLIALVYQSIVADELRILPILDVTNELKTNPAFQDVFASVIPPDRLDFFRTRLLGEVFEEESKQAKVDDFLNGLEFLKDYRDGHQGSVMLSWNARYPRHF